MKAKVEFTVDAARLAKELLSSIQWTDGTFNVFLLRWSAGNKDLIRAPNGEAVWATNRAAGWVCDLAFWAESPGKNISEHAMRIDDMWLLLAPEASSAPGTFLIYSDNGVLYVGHSEP